jgi:hypothetical protein
MMMMMPVMVVALHCRRAYPRDIIDVNRRP